MKTLLTTAAALVWACGAAAQSADCNTPNYIAERLAAGYGESLQITGTNYVFETLQVYANVTTGTWTIVAVQPNGIVACMIAAGENYRLLAEVLPPNI